MAQWQELLKLDPVLQSRVTQLYEGKFPREMRHWLCFQIESNNWELAMSDEEQASACFYSLLDYLEEQWKCSVLENNILQRPDFAGMKQYLLKNFEDEPKYLATILVECLTAEKRILNAAFNQQACCHPTLEPKSVHLDNKITCLQKLILKTKKEIKFLEGSYEGLEFIQEDCREQGNAKKKRVQEEQNGGLACCPANVEEIRQRQADIAQTKEELLHYMKKIVKVAEEIVLNLVDEELPAWKRRQQLACVGSPVNTSLHYLQDWFTSVLKVLLELRELLQELRKQNRKYDGADTSEFSAPLEETERAVASLCIKLLKNALVVEKQPTMSTLPQRPLILKTTVRFTVSVRFLANLEKFKYRLRVKPEFDKDVEEASKIKGFRQFKISKDDSKALDEDRTGGGLVAEFCHMSLKATKANSEGTTQTRFGVTEELHLVNFVTEFQLAGLECTIEASSLPVVVISSSNQVASAWASIMWCSMLCTSQPMNLSLFEKDNPPVLPWAQLSQLLSWQFLAVGQRELDQDQLFQLREKFVDGTDELVHWSKFSKDKTGWLWIAGILELIQNHLVDLWKEGMIVGFVSRKRAKQLLRDKKNGTFLLRFSETSDEAAISFSWVERINDKTQVYAVGPYTTKDLSIISLPNIVNLYTAKSPDGTESKPLAFLYPDVPKDVAFERFFNITGKSDRISGYLFQVFVPTTVLPSPPPSPPQDVMMDVDNGSLPLEELFPDVFCGVSEKPPQQWFQFDSS